MSKRSKSFLKFCIICSAVVFYLVDRCAAIFEQTTGNILERINAAITELISVISKNPFSISTSPFSLKAGLCGFVLVWFIWLYNMLDQKNFMRGIEHGSAKWGTGKDIAPLICKEDDDQNIILSATEKISMMPVKDFEHDRNKNVIVIGGTGSGKTYSLVKPNLMQLSSSYVITDPKGTLLPETGYLFSENGYALSYFNTINFAKSLHYNPLAYIKGEKDILKLVNVIIANTKGEGEKSTDDFWVKAERLWYCAAIGYLYYEAPLEDRNIPTLCDMLDLSGAKEDDEDYKSVIDIMFEGLAERKPDCFAVRQYKKFKLAAGKTLKSILISCAARLAPFDIAELREIMMYDELGLDEIGDRKTALFLIMSDTDNTYSFVIAMIFYQMFNLLTEKADDVYNGRLPFPVQCIIDEFANCIGKIPNFEKLISTIRSRGISAMIFVQSIAQLTSLYKDDADTIIDCCDSMVFLGGKSTKTTKAISETIGKTTVDNQNINVTKGSNGNYSVNDQILGRDLIDPAEIGRLERKECIVIIIGLQPFKSQKYDTSQHKRFSFIFDSKKRERFDVTKAEQIQNEHFLDHVKNVQEVNLSELNTFVKDNVVQ
jgi:type IV secretion system protein VirD4